jgi:Mn2+/Fe2+ NRAMP family transporter
VPEHPAPAIWSLVLLLFIANTVNVAADLGAMADATKLLIGGWSRRRLVDSVVAQAFSNLIAIAIIMTTAATLHAKGVTDVQSSAQAADALKPVAGALAELIFALGIVGTDLLAVPVLAGSTAYAIGEGRKWSVGIARKPKQAVAFYSVYALSVALAVALNFTPVDPIKALNRSAVVNGVAAPVMGVLMLLVRKQEVMGEFIVRGWLYWLGWLATAAMALCIIGMVATLFMCRLRSGRLIETFVFDKQNGP